MSALSIDTALGAAQNRTPAASASSLMSQARGEASARGSSIQDTTRHSAEQFESVFINTMLQSMFAGLEDSAGTWGGGTGSDAWRGMLVEQYADTIARSGGLGIADSVQRELIALQEGS
ncbi:rod-binding protein [Stappia sp.]|jgi:Rod binding domain-containing protein|uniref:rod-binding protein n=1 Tax=Stappia sp. TaxID=1870903 RepID=UPI003A9A3571